MATINIKSSDLELVGIISNYNNNQILPINPVQLTSHIMYTFSCPLLDVLFNLINHPQSNTNENIPQLENGTIISKNLLIYGTGVRIQCETLWGIEFKFTAEHSHITRQILPGSLIIAEDTSRIVGIVKRYPMGFATRMNFIVDAITEDYKKRNPDLTLNAFVATIPKSLDDSDFAALQLIGLSPLESREQCLLNSQGYNEIVPFIFTSKGSHGVTELWFYRSHHFWYWSPPIETGHLNWKRISYNDDFRVEGGVYNGVECAPRNSVLIQILRSDGASFLREALFGSQSNEHEVSLTEPAVDVAHSEETYDVDLNDSNCEFKFGENDRDTNAQQLMQNKHCEMSNCPNCHSHKFDDIGLFTFAISSYQTILSQVTYAFLGKEILQLLNKMKENLFISLDTNSPFDRMRVLIKGIPLVRYFSPSENSDLDYDIDIEAVYKHLCLATCGFIQFMGNIKSNYKDPITGLTLLQESEPCGMIIDFWHIVLPCNSQITSSLLHHLLCNGMIMKCGYRHGFIIPLLDFSKSSIKSEQIDQSLRNLTILKIGQKYEIGKEIFHFVSLYFKLRLALIKEAFCSPLEYHPELISMDEFILGFYNSRSEFVKSTMAFRPRFSRTLKEFGLLSLFKLFTRYTILQGELIHEHILTRLSSRFLQFIKEEKLLASQLYVNICCKFDEPGKLIERFVNWKQKAKERASEIFTHIVGFHTDYGENLQNDAQQISNSSSFVRFKLASMQETVLNLNGLSIHTHTKLDDCLNHCSNKGYLESCQNALEIYNFATSFYELSCKQINASSLDSGTICPEFCKLFMNSFPYIRLTPLSEDKISHELILNLCCSMQNISCDNFEFSPLKIPVEIEVDENSNLSIPKRRR